MRKTKPMNKSASSLRAITHEFWARVTAAAVLTIGVVLAPLSAMALPPDGPSPNTPGTYAEVWPTTVSAGDVLNFRVSGFPAGEIIHLKYDDGNENVCGSSAVHGACVIHTQVIPTSGVTVGSVVIPSDLPAGDHWLRFLASTPAPGGDGILGFTLRGNGSGYGNSNFTVVAGGSGGQGISAGGNGGPGNSSGGGGGGSAGGSNGGGSAPQAPSGGGAAPGEVVGEPGSVDAAAGAGAIAKAVIGEVPTDEPQTVPQAPAPSGDKLPKDKKTGVQAAIADGNLTLGVDVQYSAEWAFVYAYSEPTELGWQQVANDGTLRFSILNLEPGEHSFAVLNEDGELLGWTEATIDEAAVEAAVELATGVSGDDLTAGAEAAPMPNESALPWTAIGIGGAAVIAAALVFWIILRKPKKASVVTKEFVEGEDPFDFSDLTSK